MAHAQRCKAGSEHGAEFTLISLRSLAPAGIFALSFACAIASLSALTPRLSASLRHLAEEGAQYDTLFVGSSHLLNGLDPRVFDRAMAQRGLSTHSYSIAVQGMKIPQLSYLVESVLELNLPGLERLVIEPRWPLKQFEALEQFENRDLLQWQDFERARLSIVAAWLATERPNRKSRRILAHLHLFARNSLAVGFGRALIADRFGDARADESSTLIANRGFRALRFEDEDEPGAFAAARDEYERRLSRHRRTVSRMGDRVASDRAGRFKVAAVHALIERVADAGVKPIVLMFPTLGGAWRYYDRDFVERLGVVIEFDDPATWPELYDPTWRVNYNHFEAQGAVRFSQIVAETLADRLGAESP